MSNSLAAQVAGATRPSQLITWLRDTDGAAIDLTGATITGCIRSRSTGDTRAIVGNLVVTNPAEGKFRWDYADDDVESSGSFVVQFTATYPLAPFVARSKAINWIIAPSLCIS